MPVAPSPEQDDSIYDGYARKMMEWQKTEAIEEARPSSTETTEMDGLSPWERDNWPLADEPERSVSPETVQDQAEKEGRDVHEVDHSGDDGGQSFRTGLSQSNGRYEARQHDSVRDPNGLDTRASTPNGHRQSQQDMSSPDSSPFESSQHRSDVSPARTTSSLGTNGVSEGSNRGVDTSSEQDISDVSDEAVDRQQPASDLYEDEERDIATPIPFGNETLDSTTSTLVPEHSKSSPLVNGDTRYTVAPKASPSQQHPYRRSISAQTPYSRERVRYSWQSLHDEEPNRPRIHIIKLISNTATASAGFPQGEAFGFSISPFGRRIAAYNSARLYILQTAALPLGISQDYALKRRPLAIEIVDEGNILAILADEYTVNIYDLGHRQLQRIRTIKLDFPTACIALSPTGGLVAAAYEGGVEIFSLDPGALPTDRRSVRSQRMDKLTFSQDGSTLLGTTTRINASSTVVVSVPMFPASETGIPTHRELKEAWCAELLHPENIRNSSHSVFMREHRKTCNDRLFAWNGLADTFGILNVAEMQYGNLDFPVVISPPLSTCGGLGAAIHSSPAIDEHGETVAMIVNDRTIRLYIVPRKVDGDEDTTIEAHSIDHELDEGYGCPFSEARWVYSSASLPAPPSNQTQVQGRLVVASPGGIVEPNLGEEMVDDLEGGRIILFDFDPQFAGQAGQTFSLTLGKSPTQLLEEPELDVAHEVALVRRRTVNQSKGGTLSQRPVALGRAATSGGGRGERVPRVASPTNVAITNPARRSILSWHGLQPDATRSLPDLAEGGEPMDALEEPYAQGAPRSHASLQRAASNAQRHRFQTLEEKNQARVSVETSGNFLALPEYSEEPNAPLPSRFRVMAGLDGPAAPQASKLINAPSTNGEEGDLAAALPSNIPSNTGQPFAREQTSAAPSTSRNVTGMHQINSTAFSPPSPATADASLPSPVSLAFGPVSRTATPDSMAPASRPTLSNNGPPRLSEAPFRTERAMPRSLQRAYGHTQTRLGAEWENLSPELQRNISSSVKSGPRSTAIPEPVEIPWDTITPLPPRNHLASPSSKQSSSQLNHPGHFPSSHSPTASSFAPSSITSSSPSSRGRRLPPHMEAFRNAAAASATPYSHSNPSNHTPRNDTPPYHEIGRHPTLTWRPPAAESVKSGPASGLNRSHSRKSSIANKSAFASTTRAKSLGFFRRGTRRQNDRLFGSEFEDQQPGAGNSAESVFETKSIFTMRTRRGDAKCAVM